MGNSLADWLAYARDLLVNEGSSGTIPSKLMALAFGVFAAALCAGVSAGLLRLRDQFKRTPSHEAAPTP